MLFKRKIDVTEYCEGNLKALLSPERDAAYESLRKQCDDPSLTAVDQKLYFDHLRAVVIQLLQIAITRNSSVEISGDAHFFVAKYLKDLASPISPLSGEIRFRPSTTEHSERHTKTGSQAWQQRFPNSLPILKCDQARCSNFI
jgi:hypothetical protein